MKKFLLIILALLISLPAISQKRSFQFFYIAHDRGTPVSDLCKRLRAAYETAIYDNEYAQIFYLPNYDNPLTVIVNLPGDNRDDFDTMLAELRMKSYHEIYSDLDYENIINLMNKYDFIDDYGNHNYSMVDFCWYVNPDFWFKMRITDYEKHKEEIRNANNKLVKELDLSEKMKIE